MRLVDTEVVGVGVDSVTVALAVEGDDGLGRPAPVTLTVAEADDPDAPQRRIRVEPSDDGLALVRVDGIGPRTALRIDAAIVGETGDGATAAHDPVFFPETVRTLTRPAGERLARIATVSDLHFGEEVCGLGPSPDIGPVFRAADEDPPYWSYMNADVIAAINAVDVDAVIVKGDLTGEGRPDELGAAKAAFDGFVAPWHAVPGNHDKMQPGVDPMAELGQPQVPARSISVPGVRLVLLDTVDPGKDGGILPPERMQALGDELAAAAGAPVLVFAHHYTSTPARRRKRTFGLHREHSAELLALYGRFANVAGHFAGHTHRNRVRTFTETGPMPHVEVCATKEYPGAFGCYDIYETGYTQEVVRTPTARALRWAHRTRTMYFGLYRTYALGTLPDRCFSRNWADRATSA